MEVKDVLDLVRICQSLLVDINATVGWSLILSIQAIGIDRAELAVVAVSGKVPPALLVLSWCA